MTVRTYEEVERAFAVGWDGVPESYEAKSAKLKFADMAHDLWHWIPNGPEKTLALRTLWRAQSETQLALCIGETPPPLA